jgi:hypothetical protein
MDNGAFNRPGSRRGRIVAAAVGACGVVSSRSVASTNAVDWSQIVDSHFESGELVVRFGPFLLLAFITMILALVAWRLWLRRRLFPDFDLVEAELDIARLGKVKIKPNHENIQIAHQAWVELATRKAALPFDDDHDVVTEVYDSYYQLFSRLRDLTKAIPAQKLRKCRDTRKLVDIMIQVLNQGLRPHLTRWQARFRRWYDAAITMETNRGKPPQEIQKQFPDYAALVGDLKTLQTNVVRYAEFLREIAQGKEE